MEDQALAGAQKKATREGRIIIFIDESGISERPHRVSTWAPKGHQEGAIHLEFLPPYAPELNPVEYLWAHWKHHELANFCPKDFAELTVHARAKLRRTQRRKTLIAAFWKQAELPI